MSLTQVVPVLLGSDESTTNFGFAVRLLGVEEFGLLLHPREPTQVVWKGLSIKDSAHTAPSALL